MLKEEFEALINRPVAYDVFKMYNDMYMTTELTKEEFVKILNVKAIPEDPAHIQAMQEQKARETEARKEIQYHKECIAENKWHIEQAKGDDSLSDKKYYINLYKSSIRDHMEQIAIWKSFLASC